MKKIASLIMTAVLLAAMMTVFAVPASAGTTINGEQTLDSGSYDLITLNPGAKLTITGTVEVKTIGFLVDSELIIDANSELKGIGDKTRINMKDGGGKITIVGINDGTTVTDGKPGILNITTNGNTSTNNLISILNQSSLQYSYQQEGDHIVVGCAHSNITRETTITTKDYCNHCRMLVKTKETTETGDLTASTLSEGNMTVIVGVACSVVFLAVGFFLGRKKKTAFASGTENTDEE